MKYITIFLFLGLATQSIAQVSQPNRLEIELKNYEQKFLVVSAEERGLILTRQVQNTETRRENKYEVYHIDTAFNIEYHDFLFVETKFTLKGYDVFDEQFYMLFEYMGSRPEFYLVRMNLIDYSINTFQFESQLPLALTEFEIIENTIVLGGFVNSRPTVVTYFFGENKPKVLPGFYNNKSELLQIEMEDDKGVFHTISAFKTDRGRKALNLKTFDTNGNTVKDINIDPTDDYSLLYGRATSLKGEALLVTGTYTKKRLDMSRGLFIARVNPNGEYVINYYNFADLKNFFNYMKAKREKRVRERIERRKIKGKKNKFNYRLLVHDIVERNGRFIMVGEAYYPKYSYNSFYAGSFSYGNPYNNNYCQIFDGYKYTHAVVIGFDRRGRLMWDNSFEVNDVVSWTLDQYVHVSHKKDKTALLYLYDNEIRTKIIEKDDVVEGKSFDELKLSFDYDEVKNDSGREYGGLEDWYDNTFYAYGVQNLSNKRDRGVKLNREVFFINKIIYE